MSARLGSPYHIAASVCLGETADWIKSMGHDRRFTCVFESGDEGQGPMKEAVRAIATGTVNILHEKGIEEIVFTPKGRAGLQMADTLAWAMSHWVPDLHIDDEWARRIHNFAAARLCLLRRYIDREFMLDAAKQNTNERQLGLQAKYGILKKRQRKRGRNKPD